jgi:hypothetical protein
MHGCGCRRPFPAPCQPGNGSMMMGGAGSDEEAASSGGCDSGRGGGSAASSLIRKLNQPLLLLGISTRRGRGMAEHVQRNLLEAAGLKIN